MVFVDTNVLVAALNEHDSDHKRGKVLLESAFQKFAWLYTSDYVVDECFSIAWSKTRKLPLSFRLSLIKKIDDTVQGSEKLRLLKVDEHDFSTAKALLREHRHLIPTLTDWTYLILMKRNGIHKIISFDRHFKEARQLAEFRWVLGISQPVLYLRRKFRAKLAQGKSLHELRGVFQKQEKKVKEGIRELELEHRKEARG